MSFVKVSLFVCLILALHLCSAAPAQSEKAKAEELAHVFLTGHNFMYQVARFLFHGENMKNNP